MRLPLNIDINDEWLFENVKEGDSPPLSIVSLEKVFLTRSGIGLKDFKLVNETIHRYQGKRRYFFLYAVANFIFRKKRYLKGQYLLIHNHWCPGYYHWITEALPRLINALPYLDKCILLLPESFKTYPLESLKVYGVSKIHWINKTENVVVEKLTLPENPHFTIFYDKVIIEKIRDDFRKYLLQNNLATLNLGKNIYITRRRAGNRLVSNESGLIPILKEKGFVIVDLEDHDFWQQVSIMFYARVLVGVHGAGLSNMIFMQQNAYVLEFQRQVNRNEQFSILYFKLSQILDHTYLYQLCEPLNIEDTIYKADLKVDIARLANNLELIESRCEEGPN